MYKRPSCWFLLLPLGLQAQLLYNPARDAKAQDALTIAKSVSNGQVFDKMMDNLDRLSKASGERFFNDSERSMRATLLTFRTWGDLSRFVAALETRLSAGSPGDVPPAEIEAAMREVTTETAKAQAALQALQAEAMTRFSQDESKVALIGMWFARLGDLSDLVGFASQFSAVRDNAPAGLLDSAKEAASLAAALGKMYANFQVALANTPDIVVLETQVKLLGVHQDHLKQVVRILAQRESDLADTRHILARTKKALTTIRDASVGGDESIAVSIGKFTPKPDFVRAPGDRSPDVFGSMVSVLYNVASLAARDDTPVRLASLRLADEERRYSIRSSAVAASSYEALISTGAQRLAAYYKGGLKPETLAQIASVLATLGLIPTIAVK